MVIIRESVRAVLVKGQCVCTNCIKPHHLVGTHYEDYICNDRLESDSSLYFCNKCRGIILAY